VLFQKPEILAERGTWTRQAGTHLRQQLTNCVITSQKWGHGQKSQGVWRQKR